MKRILCIICTVILACFALSQVSFAQHTGIQNTDDLEKQQVLQLLEIMNGDENGNLNLDKTVTRAEFVKMAICASAYKSTTGASSQVSLFPDVTSSHWAAGYVSSAINAGLVTGYLDGTFKPQNTVKLEEAVIILLKMLGYTTADFSGTYPEAQLAKYNEIGLSTDIDAKPGDALTRRECMKLIYNTLCMNTKNGNVYCTTLGCASDTDGTVDYLSLFESKLKGPVVVKDTSFANKLPFDIDKAEIMLDGVSVSASQIKIYDVLYYSDTLKSVWVFRDTKTGVCTSVNPGKENPSSVVVGGNSYQLSSDTAAYKFSNYGTLKTDMLVTLVLGKDGSVVDAYKADISVIGNGEDNVGYNDVVSATLKGPYIAPADGKLLSDTKIDASSAVVYKGNRTSSLSEIGQYNVYYYSELLNTVWVYDDTVSGTLEAVSPNKVSPTSITLSGKTYSLESKQSQYDVSSLGTFAIGDRITLLLGKEGSVAGIVPAGSTNSSVYGVVIAQGKKTFTDKDGKSYSANSVTVFATNAQTYTYQTNGSFSAGDVVEVEVSEHNTSVTKMSAPKTASAALAATSAVKNGMFANNANIIEYYNKDIYSAVLASRISGKSLTYRDILYFDVNADGEITNLILDNYTGYLVEYGLILETDDYTYTYITSGEETTFMSQDVKFAVGEGAAYFVIKNNQIQKIGNIHGKVDIAVLNDNKAYTSGTQVYEVADNARVYIYEQGEYKVYDLDKLKGTKYTMTGYYDKKSDNGGKIRIIVAY